MEMWASRTGEMEHGIQEGYKRMKSLRAGKLEMWVGPSEIASWRRLGKLYHGTAGNRTS